MYVTSNNVASCRTCCKIHTCRYMCLKVDAVTFTCYFYLHLKDLSHVSYWRSKSLTIYMYPNQSILCWLEIFPYQKSGPNHGHLSPLPTPHPDGIQSRSKRGRSTCTSRGELLQNTMQEQWSGSGEKKVQGQSLGQLSSALNYCMQITCKNEASPKRFDSDDAKHF